MGNEAGAQISVEEALKLRELVKESDSIELKLTVPEGAYRSGARALGVDPLEGQIRQVFFFDTPDLALNQAGVVARARRVQGREHDSVVKLRPIVPDELPSEFRKSPNMVVEVDAMPGGYVCSASMKGKLSTKAVHESVDGGKPLRPRGTGGGVSSPRSRRATSSSSARPILSGSSCLTRSMSTTW